MDQDLEALTWYKSSRSGANNDDCVEVANLPSGGRAVRDSKDPDGPILTFAPTGWRVFIHCVKSGKLS
jgi:hypothetical protein